MQASVITPANALRVRSAPNATAIIVCSVRRGRTVNILSTQDNWAQVRIAAGDVEGFDAAGDLPAVGWMAIRSPDTGVPLLQIDEVITPPPTPATGTGKFRLGVNALSNTREAMIEAQKGCRHFLIMDSFTGAAQIKKAYPDAQVMVRRYWTYRPNVDQAIAGLEGAGDGGLIYTGTNEADVMGQGGQGLIDRAEFDVKVAKRVKLISGATYAAGTFSVGTPDFTNPAECNIIRKYYAPAYNAGLIAFDMHLYSPNMAHIYDKNNGQIWFERRWEFLFTKCEFDPNVRGIYCSETGVDEGNVGGFSAHNATDQQFADWCKAFRAVQNAPLIVDGKSYPSPCLGGAIFQLGGNGDQRWAGYDVTKYLPILRQFYGLEPKANAIQSIAARWRAFRSS
jgi:hypothetical protein